MCILDEVRAERKQGRHEMNFVDVQVDVDGWMMSWWIVTRMEEVMWSVCEWSVRYEE